MKFGLFGPVSEGAYELTPSEASKLQEEVLSYASSVEFLRKSGLAQQEHIKEQFFFVLSCTDFVGSNAGGAAGYLRLVSVPKGTSNPLKLRFALQLKNGAGNFWGLIPRKVAMRHELLHFVREAESVCRRGVSLFKAEKESKNILGRIFLMLREESFVWFRTMHW
ncbi:MAG: hypothetical protein EAZ74_00420 [Alphaproteobacteria bacterium]|nr:MAG: hypothetical protein EAY76_02890 [Alphaproteobacteria bacterium]TAF16013.1 MAG: hypothetical protein EAZ74_00420 [Alphaproteobacteria bacterium]TAF76214.1 MAG: hypothetical protein EAZ52_04770 [Alphaproteobacteria bacterium]